MQKSSLPGWDFVDDQGTFEITDPQATSYLYLPLVNQAGMMSSVTPTFNGDAKIGQNSFLLLPVSVEDLHNSRAARNFWVTVDGEPWSATGNNPPGRGQGGASGVSLTAGLLWQTVRRTHPGGELHAEVTSFVPAGDDWAELMRVVLTNRGKRPLAFTPTAAVPIYGRSADNIRDHRHVTSLLHRTNCHRHGVLVRPSLIFAEGRHRPNGLAYAVLGAEQDGAPPVGFFPALEGFVGEGGTLDWPAAVTECLAPIHAGAPAVEGCESIGALRFAERTLQPGQSASYIILLAILPDGQEPEALLARYGSADRFAFALEDTRAYWAERLSSLQFSTGQARCDGWLQWVALQPTLRRLMGNSFLPYHDYGRGGRGWRDLWQDSLALLLTEGRTVSDMLFDGFAGVRLDGSNATIIGAGSGEFKADRNDLPRVWMDHGAWPLLTLKLYLDRTGDLDFLLRQQGYFRDHLIDRCRTRDPLWTPEHGFQQRTPAGDLVEGSILEHLLVQHLTAYHNCGEHGMILLEGGDWNDAFDMAGSRGESVAFSALYAGNLRALADLCRALRGRGISEVSLASELLPLIHAAGGNEEADPDFRTYLAQVGRGISGEKQALGLAELEGRLLEKAERLADRIRTQEWLPDGHGGGWFNGYYDNAGRRLEGREGDRVRMTLAGQVFPLLAGVASDEQARLVVESVDRHLRDETTGGYRLNTDFRDAEFAMGRMTGFAYGHKENGAVFNHMAVMYACALYRRGLAQAGWRVLEGLYQQCQDFARSRMYPGIPEYFNPRGRGMYPYLTGSAAWYLFTLLTEAFGVRGELGDLVLEPMLTTAQFGASDRLSVRTVFAGKRLEIEYRNPGLVDFGDYAIAHVSVNDLQVPIEAAPCRARFARSELDGWPDETRIVIELGKIPRA